MYKYIFGYDFTSNIGSFDLFPISFVVVFHTVFNLGFPKFFLPYHVAPDPIIPCFVDGFWLNTYNISFNDQFILLNEFGYVPYIVVNGNYTLFSVIVIQY